MKIARFRDGSGTIQYGLVQGDQLQPIAGDLWGPRQPLGSPLALASVTLLAPVVPPNVLCIGRNYAEHAKEGNAEVPTSPLLFIKSTTTVNDPGAAVKLPREAPGRVDFEAELVAVIGRAAKDVPESQALSYVLGYTCGDDVSARDVQKNEGQWARGKSYDGFAPIGPWIETELDPSDLKIEGRLNGQMMQSSRTSDMVFSVAHLVANLSRSMTLLPGTIIFTGTPSGVGFARTPPVCLKPGDRYEVEIEGIGVLVNHFVSE